MAINKPISPDSIIVTSLMSSKRKLTNIFQQVKAWTSGTTRGIVDRGSCYDEDDWLARVTIMMIGCLHVTELTDRESGLSHLDKISILCLLLCF